MGKLNLESEESTLLENDDDPMWKSDFENELLPNPTEVFTVAFKTGREWESEETDDGGFTIRTKVDPRIVVYDTDDGFVYAIAADSPNPIVFAAVLSTHDLHNGAVERFVESVEDGYDGIVRITDIDAADGYGHLTEVVTETAHRLVPGE